MNDADPQSHAEQTDPTVLGETVGQTHRSGDVFPPDRPLGVNDPSIRRDGSIAPDDVETRSRREEPAGGAEPSDGGVGHDLLDPSDDPDRLDDEPQSIATVGDDADSAAEVAAVREREVDR